MMKLNMLSTFLFLALLNAFICHASSDALVVQEYDNGFDNDIDNDFENFVADCSVTTPFRITPQICWDHNFVEHIRNQPYLNNCNGAHLTSRFVNSGPTRIRNVVVTASNAATGLVTVTYEYQIKSTGKWVACPVKTLWNDVPDIDQHPSHMFQNLPANFATYNVLLTDIQSACKDVVNVVRCAAGDASRVVRSFLPGARSPNLCLRAVIRSQANPGVSCYPTMVNPPAGAHGTAC